ncbi:MAG TPA: N,N-dimethylformamidase beta subunit family domain-containing protein [Sporichthyaceae bacterium]
MYPPAPSRIRRTVLALLAVAALAGCASTASGATLAQPPPAPPGGHNPVDAAVAGLATDIVAENAKPGAKHWRLTHPAKGRELEGYADHVSVLPGESFGLFVSTTAAHFTVHALRAGWYGGDRAREVWTSAPVAGVKQAPAKEIAATRTDYAPWEASTRVTTTNWPPGSYLLRLDADNGKQSWVPITVRTPSVAGRVVLIKEVTTEQAYNLWGGRSLYLGKDRTFGSRARAVSFDRPYAATNGAALFFHDELALVSLAERHAIPVAYATDIELDADPAYLRGARAVISEGHDEYWSRAMRTAVRNGLNEGVNLAFFGANEVYRKIRFGPTALGERRLEIDYKIAREDPLFGKGEDDLVTGNWRDQPRADPESTLAGSMYACFPGDNPMVITDAKSWIWEGAGVHDGQQLRGVVGIEYNHVDLNWPTPRPIEILAHSPSTCAGRPSHADASYHVEKSGAGVFDAGTMRWVCALRHCGPKTDASSGPILSRATLNILRAFAAGPAGVAHPAKDFTTQALLLPPARDMLEPEEDLDDVR